MKTPGLKSLNLVLASLLMVGLAAPLAGCGARPTFEVPDPSASAAPSEIGVITVTVIDNNSQPVAGASVSLTDSNGKSVTAPITLLPRAKAASPAPRRVLASTASHRSWSRSC
jgi:hypothetical protein